MNIYKLIKSYISWKTNPIRFARNLGVRIGEKCRLVGKVNFGSEPYLVEIGNHVSITSSSFITHDGGVWIFREQYPDIDVIKPITINDNVFIGSDCIILPGVTIGKNTVIGAKSVVTKNLEGGYVYAGIPAKKIKSIEDYHNSLKKHNLSIKKLKKEDKRLFLLSHFGLKN